MKIYSRVFWSVLSKGRIILTFVRTFFNQVLLKENAYPLYFKKLCSSITNQVSNPLRGEGRNAKGCVYSGRIGGSIPKTLYMKNKIKLTFSRQVVSPVVTAGIAYS